MRDRAINRNERATVPSQGRRSLHRLMIALSLTVAITGLVAPVVEAQSSNESPVGLWQSIDDETGKPKALIRIVDEAGVLSGRIEKILVAENVDAVCAQCEGELKDKPIRGMAIINGLKKNTEWYEGGTILDPNNGKVYKCRLKTIEGGSKLEVRGFIGVALLGRTQTWIRQRP